MGKGIVPVVVLAMSLVASPGAAQRSDSANQPLIGLIDRYLSSPFDLKLGNALTDSADVRHDVTMIIAAPVMPWRCYPDSSKVVQWLDAMLDMTYVAANMQAQLVDRRNEDRPYEGILGVLRVYPLIRARFPAYSVPEVDGWARLPRKNLRPLADSLAVAPDSCPTAVKRFPAAPP